MEDKKLSLIYVGYVGENKDGMHEYELYFTDTPEIAWGDGWAEQCPAVVGNIPPDPKVISKLIRGYCEHRLSLAQENNCFSLQDCADGIILLCWLEIDGEFVLKIPFGEKYLTAKRKFNEIGLTYGKEEKIGDDKPSKRDEYVY
jgi:hypothetical protein